MQLEAIAVVVLDDEAGAGVDCLEQPRSEPYGQVAGYME